MTQPIVDTNSGKVGGHEDKGVLAFKGIRYAAPPTGARRFMPPAAVEPWSGVFDATALGPSCPQPRQRPAGWSYEDSEDEDCLRLNVWTPAADDARRPVMVWFHGGGYAIGSGSWPLYDGRNLAARGDVVVVTVNHRLGPLGYLDLSAYGGPELASSGNAGILDLVASLEWVRDNIAAFGGNPDNVLIFGESGGGAKVSTLLGTPAAKGLFHRAAMQSGAGRFVLDRETSAKATAGLLDKLGIAAGPGAVEALRKVPVADLVAGAGRGLGGAPPNPGGAGGRGRMGFAPVLDADVIPVHPAHALRDGQAPDVPLLIGTNFDEATLFLAGDPALSDPSKLAEADLPGRLAQHGKRAARLLEVYRKSRPDASPIDLLLAINTDAMMRIPSIKMAEKRLEGVGQAPVWMYLFLWAAGPLRAAHGFELPFMFDNVHEPVMRPSPSRLELADRMSEAWLAFARGGDPNHDGLPNWQPYDTDARATMLFDRGECRVEHDPWADERKVWFE